MMKRLSTRLIILLILSSLIPLSLFGLLSIVRSQREAYRSVSMGNLNVAKRAAEEIGLYVSNSISILEALAENINKTDLHIQQKRRMINNYVLHFEEFDEISLLDRYGMQIASSRIGRRATDMSREVSFQTAIEGDIYRSDIIITEDLHPGMIIAVPLLRLNEVDGVLIGRIDLIDMWRLVDNIRIGERGYAFVVSKDGRLIAHGLAERKRDVFRQRDISNTEIVKSALEGRFDILIYQDEDGPKKIGVVSPIASLGWVIVIEQPTSEAFASTYAMTYQLSILVILFLLIMACIGYFGGKRQVIDPINDLIKMTKTISEGMLDIEIMIPTNTEFEELSKSFNRMSKRLKGLQDDIRRNERIVTFGKIAAGLVHDLRHPIRNIENNCRLFLRMYNNREYRDRFRKIIDHESANINRFLDDLHNLTHPLQLTLIELSIHNIISNIIQLLEDEVTKNQISVITKFYKGDIRICGDRFAIERVIKNIVVNAIEAMPGGGELRIWTKVRDRASKSHVEIAISDTGCGISDEMQKTLFIDYLTTKRKGLGFGLAISRKILGEHNGSISVKSIIDVGTTVTVFLPVRKIDAKPVYKI